VFHYSLLIGSVLVLGLEFLKIGHYSDSGPNVTDMNVANILKNLGALQPYQLLT